MRIPGRGLEPAKDDLSQFHPVAPVDSDLSRLAPVRRLPDQLENLPDTRTLLRMGRAMVDLYCASFKQVPKRIVLDIDDTFDAVHGGQQLRLFNADFNPARDSSTKYRAAVRVV